MEETGGDSSATTGGGSEESNGYSRGHWRPDEDEKLRRLVKKYGPKNWNFISERLQGRSGKSCRLRWFNQLDPRIKRTPFTADEEQLLLAVHRAHGNKWSLIARLFPGRTDNAVKNHWHVIHSRRRRRPDHSPASSSYAVHGGDLRSVSSSPPSCSGINGVAMGESLKWSAFHACAVQPDAEEAERCFLSHGRESAMTGVGGASLVAVPFIDFLGVGVSS